MFRYVPATGAKNIGHVLVSDRFVCALAPLASHEKLLDLSEIMEDQSSHFEDILTFFAKDGIAGLPSFALAQLVDTATGSVLLAVRGDGRIELNSPGAGTYVGAGATTWVEGSAQQVTGMILTLGNARESADTLPVLRGIVRSTRVSWGDMPVDTSEAAAAVAPPAPIDVDDLADMPDWALPAYGSADVTVTRARSSAVAAVQGDVEIVAEEDDEKTVFVRGRGKPQADLDEDADKTVMVASRVRRNAAKTRVPKIGLPDGTTAELEQPIILGRKPRGESAAGSGARLVAVTSPTSEVSGSHVEFSAENGAVRVRDLNSTNGSTIRSPGREPFILAQGEAITVGAGTDVDVGDGNIVTVME
jgi:hypothetical protein